MLSAMALHAQDAPHVGNVASLLYFLGALVSGVAFVASKVAR